jgi:predicted Zn-dependent peptidase
MLTSCRRRYKYETDTYAFVSAKPFDDTFDLICRSEKKDEAYWKGIEQQLKMFYASMTTTEVDSVAASEIITNLQNVATQSSVASVQAANRLNCLPFESSKRLMPPTVEEAGRLSVERLRELVKDYYSNFNGTLFLICGDVNQDSIMPLVLKYIGSLPSKPEPVKRLVWSADHYKTTNTTAVEKFSNPSPLCVTALYYTWEKGFQLNQDVRALNHALQSVLGELLLNRIRVQHGDVYTPACQVVDDLLPVPRMRCAISYTCNPTQRERIAKDVIQLVNEMAEGDLITQELVDNYIKNRENARKPYEDGVDGPCSDYIERELNGILLKNDDLTCDKKVTPSSLKDHLKQLLKKGNLHVGYLTTE